MPRELSPLPRTSLTGLDFNNIIQDVINLVEDNPDYNSNWDDFLSSNAGRMFIELFAYITDQLATRIDWVANENWITTATQKKSVIRLLKIIGYNFTLPISSEVSVTITGDTFPGNYYLTDPYDADEGTLTPFSMQASNKKGATKTYEALIYDSTAKKFEYKIGVEIESNSEVIEFYEGQTIIDNFTATNDNGPVFYLTQSPVTENSVRIYLIDDTGPSIIESELLKVNTFLDADAQSATDITTGDSNPIPYILSVNEDDTVSIEFGTTGLLPEQSRRLAVGDDIKVFYRVGGGVDGNLTTKSINVTKTLSVIPIGDSSSTIINNTFINKTSGVGGKNGETPEEASISGPLEIRTVKKAVTTDDYDILIQGNSNILTSKTYGASNQPSDTFSLYGEYIKPYDVWIYAVPDTSGGTDLKTSNYNSFEWISLRLQNYFNSIHSFRPGVFNDTDSINISDMLGFGGADDGDTIDWNGTGGDSFKNYVIIDTPSTIITDFPGNSDFKLKIGDTGDTTNQFFNISGLLVGDTIRVGDTPGDSILQITDYINAYFQSLINIETGVDMSAKKSIRINVDGKGETTIDLTSNALDASSVKPEEIAVAINKSLNLNINYGAGGDSVYGDTNGLNGVASVIDNGDSEFIRLESPKQGESSTVDFIAPTGGDTITDLVFGSDVNTGDTTRNYGISRLTLITNSSLDDYGKIIYERGSRNLETDPDTYYVHYISGDTDFINLGTYFNDNFITTDPEYRDIARRVYNTINESGDSIPDMDKSNFILKFTGESTSSMSLLSITNKWNLVESITPTITGDSIGDSPTFDSSNYSLRINIDGNGDTEFDVTGDSGTSGTYAIENIISNINTELQNAYTSFGTTYNQYAYSVIRRGDTGTRIIFTSPTATNSSSIKTLPAANHDSLNEVFGSSIGDSGDSHLFQTSGDYYLNYNSSSDLMQLFKINTGTSVMPDLDIFVHFIWDRRSDTTTEDTYKTFLENTKIVGLNNIFKQPKFSTFDIFGEVFYKQSYSLSSIKNNVENTIKNKYLFINSSNTVLRDFGQNVTRSVVLKTIQDIEGVEYANLSYFGRDQTDSSTNQENQIVADFDEILILSDLRKSGADNIHGLSLTYTSVEV